MYFRVIMTAETKASPAGPSREDLPSTATTFATRLAVRAALETYPTSCYVYYLPKSTNFRTVTSGEHDRISNTVYTSQVTFTNIHTAIYEANCFTLDPQQPRPPPYTGTDWVLSCTTRTVTGTTATSTYPLSTGTDIFSFTYRANTATISKPDFEYQLCHAVPAFLDKDHCAPVATLTWAAFVLTFISVQLSWWLFDLPIIFKFGKAKKGEAKAEQPGQPTETHNIAGTEKHGQVLQVRSANASQHVQAETTELRTHNNIHFSSVDHDQNRAKEGDAASEEACVDMSRVQRVGTGIAAYLGTVMWTCARMHLPSVSALMVIGGNHTASEMSRCYHLGIFNVQEGEKIPPWTLRKYLSSLFTNLVGVASTALTIYQTCTLPEINSKSATMGLGMWAFPSLAPSLLGLGFMACGFMFKSRGSKGFSGWILLILLLLAIGVGVTITLLMWRFGNTHGIWWISTLLYFVSLIPFGRWHPLLAVLCTALTTYFRVGGITGAALHHYGGGQPYCLFHGRAFGVIYVSMGIGADLLSLPFQLAAS